MNGDNRNDVGLKIALPDRDVSSAGDTDLILNSSWPTLQIAFETTVTGQAFTPHNLPFIPFTIIWTKSSSFTYSKSIPDINDTNIFHGTGTVHIKCYNLDITKDKEYPFIDPPGAVVNTDTDFGFKMVKEGKSLDSDDLRDYLIHTRCQSPLVLAVKTEETASEHPTQGRQINYQSPYPFPSWVFGFVWVGALRRYSYAPYFAQAYPVTRIRDNSYNLQFLDGRASLVVLRDPFFSPTQVEMNY